MRSRIISILLFLSLFFSESQAQQHYPASQIKLKLDKLSSLGSVLYFAAHPDDENTKLIAWLANEKKFKTSYLSLTRGDGGQNLIGTEQGIELGLIRTQELLAARKIDQGDQYFTSAYDFGFSKTHEETFNFWQKEETLKEAVYLIRKLQPDVIITRFPPDSRGGHGHHQASAILAHEAFLAAADPNRFPEQLQTVKPWQAKRLVWNTANFGGMNNTSEEQLKVDIGNYNPLLGYSYGEISALSRSQHKSQGFGSAAQRGPAVEYFEHVAGDKAQTDLFEGIISDWSRLQEPKLTASIQKQILQLQSNFNPNHPESSLIPLSQLHKSIQELKPSFWRANKLKEVEDLLVACAGLRLDALAEKPNNIIGETINYHIEAINRNKTTALKVISIDGKAIGKEIKNNELFQISEKKQLKLSSQPYWLEEPLSLGKFQVKETDFGYPEKNDYRNVQVNIELAGIPLSINCPLNFRYVDPVKGEIYEPITVSPTFTFAWDNNNLLLQNGETKTLHFKIQNHSSQTAKGNLTFKVEGSPDLQPKEIPVNLAAGTTWEGQMEVSLASQQNVATIIPQMDGETLLDYHHIEYDHIPSITWFPASHLQVKALNLINPVKRVAYIHGAGDLVPVSLANIGIQVDLLQENTISAASLKNYDAVIVGIRAYNVSKTVGTWLPQVFQYVKDGGVALVQYNVNSNMGTSQYGPYPMRITRDRVTEEDALVHFLLPNDPALNYPNKISPADFDGWVQERGLYFAEDMDAKYRSPLAFADKNESQNKGSLLITDYGKGKFVYTSLAFFRQLPAGVPGAYRLFVNLLAKEVK